MRRRNTLVFAAVLLDRRVLEIAAREEGGENGVAVDPRAIDTDRGGECAGAGVQHAAADLRSHQFQQLVGERGRLGGDRRGDRGRQAVKFRSELIGACERDRQNQKGASTW